MLEAQDRKLKTYKNILFETALGKLIIINKSVLIKKIIGSEVILDLIVTTIT